MSLVRPDEKKRDAEILPLKKKIDSIDSELKTLDKLMKTNSKEIKQSEKLVKSNEKEFQKIHREVLHSESHRDDIHGKIKNKEIEIKRKNAEIKSMLVKNNEDLSVDSVDSKIVETKRQLTDKDLTLVEKRKLSLELQSLQNHKKKLIPIKSIQDSIESDRAELASLKEQLHANKLRELKVQLDKKSSVMIEDKSKLFELKERKNFEIFSKTHQLHQEKSELLKQINKLNSNFDKDLKKFNKKNIELTIENEKNSKLKELEKEKLSKLDDLNKKLLEAKTPAFQSEIKNIQTCLLALDEDYHLPKNIIFNNSESNTDLNKLGQKTVDEDLEPMENKYELEHYNTAPSKSKKLSKQNQPSSSSSQESLNTESANKEKFSLEPTLITSLATLDISIPVNKDQTKRTIEELREKLKDFEKRQIEVTEKNINKVQNQIEKMESDYSKQMEQVTADAVEKLSNKNNQKRINNSGKGQTTNKSN
ncbi:hypothetical protein Kpol_479p8 [Vanderwaltozyma polyspora DSM 70294]|uniref:Uncharacterized protein n=1 Tax=Vanderwaltozyma polyspora (strain ATCC 22028 / DSM 70294 / BCRC 21397 / CBS 2163 / NBRC 10782 / NRRL Y-8283 / UCD 57-17) TaxID=436907 RepID=A7TQC1_VANPO|nr:uncharacterized protein Kpol_479p8 [Vanderwaltozyma polyspora DSM 70294]EDO15520.1 hypothetical protein Kpol_479p8 [Vanderwaltozyma polyspora DSM 70294]